MKGTETKKKIICAATDLFWSRSFHGVSVADVAKKAQINKATLYQHFASKEELAVAVVIYGRDQTLELIFKRIFGETEDPETRLELIYRRVFATHESLLRKTGEARGCPSINLAMELAVENDEVRQEIAKTMQIYAEYYRDIARALSPQRSTKAENAVVDALVRNMNGAMVASKIEKRPDAILDALATAKMLASS